MPDEHRVTIRLTPALYAQLVARGSRGQPLAAIVREALTHYLTRQPASAESPIHLAETVAAMAASLDELRSEVTALSARLESVAALGSQPAASPRQPSTAIGSHEPRGWQPSTAIGSHRDTPSPPSPQLLGTYDPRAAASRIQALRQQGRSYEAIAAQLTTEGIPTRYGLPWQHSSVRHVLKTYGETR